MRLLLAVAVRVALRQLAVVRVVEQVVILRAGLMLQLR
jgi:hypothetical protein